MMTGRWVRFPWVLGLLLCSGLASGPASGGAGGSPPVPGLSWNLGADTTLRLEVAERLRGEFVDWFGDPLVGSTFTDRQSRYDFLGHRLQVGARLNLPGVEGFLQGQNTVLTGLPRNGVGVGSVYFANTPEQTQATVFVRQGWVRWAGEQISVTIGRQLFRDAAQTLARDPALRWIQEVRWSQRLIGPFDYTHGGRSFDGATFGYVRDPWDLSAFAFVPTFGGFETDGLHNIPEIRVAGLSLQRRDGTGLLPHTLARAFWTIFEDERALEATDSRPLAERQRTVGSMLRIHTVGAAAAQVLELPSGKLDATVFLYGQAGDWQNLDHRAWAYGVEAGHRWTHRWAEPWLRVGVNVGSGDPDQNDRTHETFFQMLPTAWQYAMFPFYNMMNNRDVFVQGLLSPTSWCSLRLDWHWLRAQQRRDLVYSGGGATRDSVFGYAGVPSNGEKELAHLVHAYLTLKPHPKASVNLLYAHAFGQAILARQFSSRHGNYGFIETVIGF